VAARDPEYLAILWERAAYLAAVAADAPVPGSAPPDDPHAPGVDEGAVVRYWREADRVLMGRVPRVPVDMASLTVPGVAGDLAARLYRPTEDARTLLVFFHGGGWCYGDLDSYDPMARALAVATGAAVLSVAYRLAPEDPFPAGLDDASSVLAWALAGPATLGADRVGVAGDSAGGNLATVAARRMRDAGRDNLACQLLIYPGVDLRSVPPHPDPDPLSADDSTPADNVRRYLAGADPADPDVSPLLAPDLRGMPPTVLVTAEYDRYRAQGLAYGEALRAAGVAVTGIDAGGLDHGFLSAAPAAAVVRPVLDQLGAAVRAALDSGAAVR
ncbi:MAG TPA: alpha/beta hydrolase, partial [Pilimelia sp.]|nr:alpha/beta hydrolase [Pilimelia sp.]